MTGFDLTDEQREAVERREGALFLSAGAGSGKTRVLVERFVRAVCEDGVAVERILAITFTEKAAAELKGRLREAFLDRGERDHARSAEAAFISTIHGFCARLLRAHALAAGLDPEYGVLAETDAARLQYAAFDGALEAFMGGASAADRVDLVASYTRRTSCARWCRPCTRACGRAGSAARCSRSRRSRPSPPASGRRS